LGFRANFAAAVGFFLTGAGALSYQAALKFGQRAQVRRGGEDRPWVSCAFAPTSIAVASPVATFGIREDRITREWANLIYSCLKGSFMCFGGRSETEHYLAS
jgi:hypothetical protein